MRSPVHVVRHAPGPAIGVTAFALVAVLMTMMVAGTLMKSAGTDPQEYHALFRDTNGLSEGDGHDDLERQLGLAIDPDVGGRR